MRQSRIAFRPFAWLIPMSFAALLIMAACQPSDAPAEPPLPTTPAANIPIVPVAPTTAAAPEAQPSTAASPGAATPRPASTVDPATFEIELTPVVRGLQEPIYVTHAGDGSSTLYAVEKAGGIRVIANGAAREQPFLDIRALVRSQDYERGLLGLAFHPDYRTNRYFFVNYTNQQGHTVVARYTALPDGSAADPASAKRILFIEQPFSNHNGGHLLFGPDGKLWIGTGDGGSGGDPRGNAQNRGQLLGKMLRIDVDGGDPYGVPADNPFVGQEGARPEIWAVGLRNPWRYSFDREAGYLYVADVGQNSWEEINRVAASNPGLNYGWNLMEGTHCFRSSSCDRSGLVLPIHEYATREAGNCSVIGGYVYRGRTYPTMAGAYLYGDLCSGRIWALAQQADGAWSNTEMLDTTLQISSFGEDEAGELYVTAMDGGVYRVTAVPRQARTAGGNCSVCHVPSQQREDGAMLLAASRRPPGHP